ncbi:MAG: RNA methyltransferase [Chloroflexota bacterium]
MITSLQNERVKLIRALQSSGKSRRKENRVALEGVRLVADALAVGSVPDFVLYTADAIAGDQPGSRLFADLQQRGVTCLEASGEVFAHAAETQSPQGIIAVVPLPELPIPTKITLALILDGIADPGNLGTILRTAAAAGADLVILAPHCVDAFNAKVLRSGMGAHFRIPVVRRSWPDIARDYGETLAIYLADAHGETRYDNVDWKIPSAVIIGSEAHGADQQALQVIKGGISIPMANAAESLNAAAATSAILFEIQRQRNS